MVELPSGLPEDPGPHPDAHVDPDGRAVDLLVAAPEGPHVLGPATVDSDADGRADTVVVAGPEALTLGTDVDGDARVDVLTQVHGDGTATTVELPDEPAPRSVDDPTAAPWDEGPVPPAPTIDPATGRWVRDDRGAG